MGIEERLDLSVNRNAAGAELRRPTAGEPPAVAESGAEDQVAAGYPPKELIARQSGHLTRRLASREGADRAYKPIDPIFSD